MKKYCIKGIQSVKLPNGEIVKFDPTKRHDLNKEYTINISKIKSVECLDFRTKQKICHYEL